MQENFNANKKLTDFSSRTESVLVNCYYDNILFLSQDLDEAAAVSAALREPWIYLRCGHVYSYHNWKASAEEDNSQRTCPLCRKVGPYVKLELGQQRAFFIDNGSLTHAFVPCGHVTTERSTV